MAYSLQTMLNNIVALFSQFVLFLLGNEILLCLLIYT